MDADAPEDRARLRARVVELELLAVDLAAQLARGEPVEAEAARAVVELQALKRRVIVGGWHEAE